MNQQNEVHFECWLWDYITFLPFLWEQLRSHAIKLTLLNKPVFPFFVQTAESAAQNMETEDTARSHQLSLQHLLLLHFRTRWEAKTEQPSCWLLVLKKCFK